mmetsp:Transcript_19/g.33  ORF Transcript_19/g.33 Transcript_19/m.33 type:complete len:237 (+) Transcript_19:1309-2019(+)
MRFGETSSATGATGGISPEGEDSFVACVFSVAPASLAVSLSMYFAWMSMAFSAFCSNASSSSTVRAWLTTALFWIAFARLPNRSVLRVSCALNELGETLMTSQVLALPPRDSWSMRVSLESRYGMCVDFPSVKALITLPRAERERLILLASSSLSPVAPVFLTISEPAKSTKLILLVLVVPDFVSVWTSCKINTEWLRELPSFIPVAAETRLLEPKAINSIISSILLTYLSLIPST